jgi:hypothetical protein
MPNTLVKPCMRSGLYKLIYFPLSIINYPLSIIHYPLSIIHYPLSIIHYPLSIIHYPLSIIHYYFVPFPLMCCLFFYFCVPPFPFNYLFMSNSFHMILLSTVSPNYIVFALYFFPLITIPPPSPFTCAHYFRNPTGPLFFISFCVYSVISLCLHIKN